MSRQMAEQSYRQSYRIGFIQRIVLTTQGEMYGSKESQKAH